MTDMRDRLERLPLARRTRFLALLRGDRDDPARPGLVPRASDDPAPLSYAQSRLWALDKLTPGSNSYNIILAFQLGGQLHRESFTDALTDLVARHEPLRTRLPELGSGPAQVVDAPWPVKLSVTQVPGNDLAARRGRCDELVQEFALGTFDLEHGPLWRCVLYQVDPHEHMFVFVIHHIVFDSDSAYLLMRDLAEFYRARITGTQADLPALTVQYADFAAREQAQLSGERLDRLTEFWRERLHQAPLLEIPGDRPRPAQSSARGGSTAQSFDAELTIAVRRLANQLGTTSYPVYLAAFGALLQRYSGQDDLVIGCATMLRDRPELEPLLGFFMNLLPLRLDLAREPTFLDLVGRTDSVLKQSLAHVEFPFDEMVKVARLTRDPARPPLAQVSFLCQGPQQWPSLPGLTVSYRHIVTHTSKSDMTLLVVENGADSTLSVEYSADLFDQPTMAAMLTHYKRLLAAFLQEPERPVIEADLTSTHERAALIECGRGPVRQVRPVTVHEWFAEQALCTPDQLAVVAGDRQLTYSQLDQAANRLAWQLRREGVGPEQRVALLLPRGIDYPVAALAVLKAGGGFVPLDPTHPPERLVSLFADAVPTAVVTDQAHLFSVPKGEWSVCTVAADLTVAADIADGAPEATVSSPPGTVGQHNLAYMIYTSGSTGTPKGVLVEHHSVIDFIESVRDLFDLGAADRVLGYASYTFDVSIFEMFAALLTGAQLHVALEHERLDLDRLQAILRDRGITVIDMPPSVMALLDPKGLEQLRVAFVGGEAFSGDLVNRWNHVARFVNGYGPTEGTVTMIAQDCDGHWEGSPPIGWPMANHVAYVVDERLRLVPYGVPGELVIGGAGLARGYLSQPKLTREKFIPDPFGVTPDGRLYRTGDLVRQRRSGELVFIGRIDRQVKLRGIRIEPDEIESLLASHPAVRQALVQVWSDPTGTQQLVAYVAVPPTVDQPAPSPKQLTQFVAAKLPSAVVPKHVVVLSELPLTASGKVDRAALPWPDDPVPKVSEAPEVPQISATAPSAESSGFVEPPSGEALPNRGGQTMSQTEQTLAQELFGKLLGRSDIGPADDFFELGGASLQAAQLISAIRQRFTVEISVADFFLDPTVSGLAAVVDRQRARALDDDQILELIEGMSDDMVEQLIGHSGSKADG